MDFLTDKKFWINFATITGAVIVGNMLYRVAATHIPESFGGLMVDTSSTSRAGAINPTPSPVSTPNPAV